MKAIVHSNDPVRSKITLSVYASVKRFFYVEPPFLSIPFKPGEGSSRDVDIRAVAGQELTLYPETWSLSEKIDYELIELVPKSHYKVKFTTSPGLTDNCHGQLLIKTDIPGSPIININVRATIDLD